MNEDCIGVGFTEYPSTNLAEGIAVDISPVSLEWSIRASPKYCTGTSQNDCILIACQSSLARIACEAIVMNLQSGVSRLDEWSCIQAIILNVQMIYLKCAQPPGIYLGYRTIVAQVKIRYPEHDASLTCMTCRASGRDA